MRCATLLLLALLPSCQQEARDQPDTVVVKVIDPEGRPVRDAIVWTLPSRVWENRRWVPVELWPYYGNPHELLRRLGRKQSVAADATVRVPRGSVIAGESGALAGMATIGKQGGEITLSSWRWTIVVRDEAGAPVAGVPVACVPEPPTPSEQFEGVPLGLTDAQGQVVVRDPASVRVASFLPRPMGGPEPESPAFVMFEVDGMYLQPHAERLPLQAGKPGTVTLTLPPVTKIEVRQPEWGGPIAAGVTMTRTGKGMQWDGANCWVASGKHYGLVGAAKGSSATPIVVELAGTTIRTRAEVPQLPAGETFPVTIALAESDAIIRARLRDSDGQPLRSAVLRVTPATESLRTWFAVTDGEGRIALVVDADAAGSAKLVLEIEASPVVELLGATAELQVDELVRGERRDVGAVTVSRGG